ncbi:hypothetical protein H7J86_00910 [Mycobacterium hackensackense]|nr:hypothetical protein [Mycobacterium hackensackense]
MTSASCWRAYRVRSAWITVSGSKPCSKRRTCHEVRRGIRIVVHRTGTRAGAADGRAGGRGRRVVLAGGPPSRRRAPRLHGSGARRLALAGGRRAWARCDRPRARGGRRRSRRHRGRDFLRCGTGTVAALGAGTLAAPMVAGQQPRRYRRTRSGDPRR